MKEFRAKNHYVPMMYLKNWAKDKRVWTYRKLVSSSNVPTWEQKSIKTITRIEHLYTTQDDKNISDEFEVWMHEAVENPARISIEKVVENGKLSSDDYTNICRFLIAQSIRTPAYYIRMVELATKIFPEVAAATMQKAERKLKNPRFRDQLKYASNGSLEKSNDYNLKLEFIKTEEDASVRIEGSVGGQEWVHHMKRLITNRTYDLTRNRWFIIPASREPWPTSDDPVVRLNKYAKGWDLQGGLNRRGTFLALPLSPNHLFCTNVKYKISLDSLHKDAEICDLICNAIVQNGLQYVFSEKPSLNIPQMTPRIEDANGFNEMQEAFKNWHVNQNFSI